MTFKTKFKIGDLVVIQGERRRIEGVRLEVSAAWKMIFYRYSLNGGTVLPEISESDLLRENPVEAK